MSSPEWIIAGCTLLGAIVTVVVFSFMTFQTKDEARQVSDGHNKNHDALQARVTLQDGTLQSVARDVSYIRGKMDGTGIT